MKTCKNCNEEKALTEFYQNKYGIYQARCKPCFKQHCLENQRKRYHTKEYKEYVKKANARTKDDKKKWVANSKHGVYLVKYRWLNFYVGEGNLRSRKVNHFSKVGSRGGNTERYMASRVADFVYKRNLPHKYLSFQVLEYEDNKTRMLELEDKYRRELKPYMNPL